MSCELVKKLEKISGLIDEHLCQTRQLFNEAQTIRNQVNDALQEMRKNNQPGQNPAPIVPVEPSSGVTTPGADPVAALVAENMVGRAAGAQVPEATRPAAKRPALDQAGPANAKHRKLNSRGFGILDCASEDSKDYDVFDFATLPNPIKLSDFVTAQGKLCENFDTAKLFLRFLEESPDSDEHMKEYYVSVHGFHRNKKIIQLYEQENGFPEETTDQTKLLLKEDFDLLS